MSPRPLVSPRTTGGYRKDAGMGNIYEGRIKVVGADMLCYPVDAVTLEPRAGECYDPYAYIHPTPGAVEVISIAEWYRRRNGKAVPTSKTEDWMFKS